MWIRARSPAGWCSFGTTLPEPAVDTTLPNDSPIAETYGGRVRVRVGALLFDDDKHPASLLLVEHNGMHDARPFWTPPGGGVEFGESLAGALRREVEEETDLVVRVGPLRYVLDFVRPPLHAVSFYFECYAESGTLQTGSDPELGEAQLIRSSRFVRFEELAALTVYPEGIAERLPADALGGFTQDTQYLGTLR